MIGEGQSTRNVDAGEAIQRQRAGRHQECTLLYLAAAVWKCRREEHECCAPARCGIERPIAVVTNTSERGKYGGPCRLRCTASPPIAGTSCLSTQMTFATRGTQMPTAFEWNWQRICGERYHVLANKFDLIARSTKSPAPSNAMPCPYATRIAEGTGLPFLVLLNASNHMSFTRCCAPSDAIQSNCRPLSLAGNNVCKVLDNVGRVLH